MISGLNSNHERSLLAGIRHIDELLAEIESAATAGDSPFARRFDDLSPVERRVILDSVAALRGRMTSALLALEMPTPPPGTAASWAIQTALSCAQITVQEMAPSRLAGYGPVGPDAARLLEVLNSDLERTLKRLGSYLSRGLGKDLVERLDRLKSAPVDPAAIKLLERVITDHGLVEFQGPLAALVERLETTSYEIALFGRVSSGKSSLLNSVLGFAVLPVGVTPVTAVPTRVAWGDRAEAEIRFADAPSETLPLERLEEFVSERENPENRKHVARAEVRIPARPLRGGVVFVDTPGVGSLATSGGRESYAYLPRCDLGVLLIDAGSSPGREEIDLLRLLYESAIPPMVVVSKADLLSAADRARLKAYLEDVIAKQLGAPFRASFVSTVGGDATLARDWFGAEIEPFIARSADLAKESARRKLGLLREGVLVALRQGLESGRRSGNPRDADLAARTEEIALRAEARIAEASARLRRIGERTRTLADPTIESAASEIARRIAGKDEPRAAEILKKAVVETASEARSEAVGALVAARDALRGILEEITARIGGTVPDPAEINVDLLALPSVSAPSEIEGLTLSGPSWFSRNNPRAIARKMSMAARGSLVVAFQSYGNDLLRRGERALASLAEQFAAQAEPLRARSRPLPLGAGTAQERKRIESDLRELEALSSVRARSASGGAISVPR